MSRLRPLHLDFNGAARLPPLWGPVVLGMGLLLCAGVGVDYLGATDDLAAWQARLGRLERQRARQPALAAPATASALAEQDRRQLADAALQLRRPWDLLLQDVEGAVDDSVAILSLEPDAARQQLRITGEARQLGDALAFVGRLGGAAVLQRPTLTGHQSRVSEGVPVVVFTVLAGWREG